MIGALHQIHDDLLVVTFLLGGILGALLWMLAWLGGKR